MISSPPPIERYAHEAYTVCFGLACRGLSPRVRWLVSGVYSVYSIEHDPTAEGLYTYLATRTPHPSTASKRNRDTPRHARHIDAVRRRVIAHLALSHIVEKALQLTWSIYIAPPTCAPANYPHNKPMHSDTLNTANVIQITPMPVLALLTAEQIIAIIRRSARQANIHASK